MCCLFGVLDHGRQLTARQKNRIVAALAAASEARGTDATGVAFISEGKLRIHKEPLPGHRMRFRIPADAPVIMGHTRLATQGKASKNRNNHPFLGKGEHEFALAHNGVLFNDRDLRRELHLPSTKIETDSYVAVQILEQKKRLDAEALRGLAEAVRGSFVFTLLDHENTLHVIRGDNPFCLYHFPKRNLYVYASTEAILQTALKRLKMLDGQEVPVQSGEILQIRMDGSIQRDYFDDMQMLTGWSPYWRARWSCDDYWTSTPKQATSHLEELKTVAIAFGYAPEDVDLLAGQGFTAEEIEEFFYYGEL